LRNVGGSVVDEFQRFGFEHEAKELLIGFSFKDNWFSINACVQKDFVGWELLKTSIAKNESVVNVADMFNEGVMV
jgi:hypothetical protein